MKIVIPGGSGLLGQVLARHFHARGDEVVILSRRANVAAPWRTIAWDGASLGAWVDHLDGADAVINLAGRSVNCRYNARNRRDILASRVTSTQLIGRAIAACSAPPPTWLQASTATIYAHRYDAPNDEPTGIIGGHEPEVPPAWHFSIEVATAWERALDEADVPTTRKVKLRAAMVMAPDRGGTFDILLRLVRLGLGGRMAHGRQYISWIHHRDFVRAVEWILDHPQLDGAVNLAAPRPLPNAEFMAQLRRAYGRRVGLPAAQWMLSIGTWLMRSEAELVLKSRRVVPRRLLDAGFAFEFPEWASAAADLCREWRGESSPRRQSQVPMPVAAAR